MTARRSSGSVAEGLEESGEAAMSGGATASEPAEAERRREGALSDHSRWAAAVRRAIGPWPRSECCPGTNRKAWSKAGASAQPIRP